MKAVILAGGKGTRLRPFTFSVPKPLFPLGDRTLIQVAIEHLKSYGIREVILSTGYLSELVQAFCRDGSQWGVSIEYSVEDKPLGTAGPLALLRERLCGESAFLVMNGDVVTDFDLEDFAERHRTQGCRLTVAYIEVEWQSPFGVLDIADGEVKSVDEKPAVAQTVSAGMYILDPGCLDLIPRDCHFNMPELIQQLRAGGESVGAFKIDGFWKGLETTEQVGDMLRHLEGRMGRVIQKNES